MKIGIAAPVEIHSLREFLPEYKEKEIPKGMGGTIIPTYMAKEFINRGHSVSLYTLDSYIDQPVTLAGENLKIYIGKYRKRARYRALDFFAVERKCISDAIMSDMPDIVNAHWTYEFALAAQATKVPTIITARDAPFAVLRHYPTKYRFIRLLMAWRVISRASHMTAVSEYIAQHLRKYFGYTQNVRIIHNGIYFPENESQSRIGKKEHNRIVYFSICNGWGRMKNEERLLRAFNTIHQKKSDIELWMFGKDHGVGEGAYQWAIKNGFSAGVKFVGEVPHDVLQHDLSRYADILVHPSLEESFGNIFLEALVNGVPVIGGRNSGAVPFVLDGGRAGLLVDVTSTQELADGMMLLGENEILRHDYVKKGREFVRNNFAISKMIDQYLAAYKNGLE